MKEADGVVYRSQINDQNRSENKGVPVSLRNYIAEDVFHGGESAKSERRCIRAHQ